jgi:hypothetical protein
VHGHRGGASSGRDRLRGGQTAIEA